MTRVSSDHSNVRVREIEDAFVGLHIGRSSNSDVIGEGIISFLFFPFFFFGGGGSTCKQITNLLKNKKTKRKYQRHYSL